MIDRVVRDMDNIRKWDLRFLVQARRTASYSKDPSTKVGSVIVDRENRVLSSGYNGLPQRMSDDADILNNRERKLRHIIHAEENSIIMSYAPLAGATLYSYPLPPCLKCTSLILQAGIGRIVSQEPNPHSKWHDELIESAEIFHEAGVRIRYYSSEDIEQATVDEFEAMNVDPRYYMRRL